MRQIYNRKRSAKIRPAAIASIMLGSVLLIVWVASLAANREAVVHVSTALPATADETPGSYVDDISIDPKDLPSPGPDAPVFVVGKRSWRYHWRHDCPTFYKRAKDSTPYSKAYAKRITLRQVQAQERGLNACFFCKELEAQAAKDGRATER